MNYTEIFDDVVEIMKHDSATCKDIPGGDPAPFRERITADMTDDAFAELVGDYLLTFQLTGHLSFHNLPEGKLKRIPPVTVQRYDGALYVTRAAEDSDFSPGDRIVAMDGMTIDDAAKKYEPVFVGELPERQGMSWRFLLLRAQTVTVIKKGETVTTEMPFLPSTTGLPKREFAVRSLSPDTLLMTLPGFDRLHCVEDLIKPNRRALWRCRYLVIDARGNVGGNSGEYHCLYPYCFPKGKRSYPVYASFACEINYTEQNCDLKREILKDYGLKENSLREYSEKRGQGFVTEGDSKKGNRVIRGRTRPKKVLILTDEICGSSGDGFVAEMKCSPKVTVIGRATAGINDYTDICIKKYGDFSFMYPMKRSLLLDRGEGQARKGVPVDIHIPWTPEHLERDVELETALRLIEEDRKTKSRFKVRGKERCI